MDPKLRPDSVSAEFEIVHETPRFQRVYWTREPHLRKLYGMAIILMVASATTGYDSMLVNTSQQIDAWNHFFFPEFQDDKNVADPALNSKLAILINMFNIGSIVSFFITPYVADHFGRRTAIIAGCTLMVTGGFLTAFSNGYGKSPTYGEPPCGRAGVWLPGRRENALDGCGRHVFCSLDARGAQSVSSWRTQYTQ
ncbi:hypothetical protein VTH06DRAFT_3991 [Thermothelomyces fergusii]